MYRFFLRIYHLIKRKKTRNLSGFGVLKIQNQLFALARNQQNTHPNSVQLTLFSAFNIFIHTPIFFTLVPDLQDLQTLI